MVSKKITRTLTTVLVICLILCGTAAGFYIGLSYVYSQSERYDKLDQEYQDAKDDGRQLIDENTPGAIELILPRGVDTQDIAEILEAQDIIGNTFLFTLLSKFNGFDGTYVAGTHYVLKNMSYDEVMYMLSQNPKTVTITFPEGLSYKDIKQKLKDAGVAFDEAVMDDMVRNPQVFLDYDFVTQITANPGRDWLLQGYLWPDTYSFDVNTDEETILRTFLNNTESKLAKYYARAEKKGLTIDQAITLASIIEKECGKTEEMCTVSSVFWNRIKREYPLQSCATVNYLLAEAGLDTKLYLSLDDLNYQADNLYNTYHNNGLPPGPICSPGDDALTAALWPSKTDFFFFCAKPDGYNDFSVTQNEHDNKVKYYSSLQN